MAAAVVAAVPEAEQTAVPLLGVKVPPFGAPTVPVQLDGASASFVGGPPMHAVPSSLASTAQAPPLVPQLHPLTSHIGVPGS